MSEVVVTVVSTVFPERQWVYGGFKTLAQAREFIDSVNNEPLEFANPLRDPGNLVSVRQAYTVAERTGWHVSP